MVTHGRIGQLLRLVLLDQAGRDPTRGMALTGAASPAPSCARRASRRRRMANQTATAGQFLPAMHGQFDMALAAPAAPPPTWNAAGKTSTRPTPFVQGIDPYRTGAETGG
jgi:hypothetical protein